jgi:hypothetical protein
MHHNRTMLRGLALIALIFSLLLCSTMAQTVASTDSLVDDVPEYQGTLGPDSIFYGMKLAMENLDEAFTADETERMEKMMVHAELRISETKTMLKYREVTSADRAMEAYQEKLNQASGELDRPGVNEEDLVPVQKTMFRYHAIIQDLQSAYPDSATLAEILDDSTAVQDQFTERTKVKIQRKEAGGNEMVTVRVQEKEKNKPKGTEGSGTETPTASPSPDETATTEPATVPTTPEDQKPGGGQGHGQDKDKDTPKGADEVITGTLTAAPSPMAEPTTVQTTPGTPQPGSGDQGKDKDKEKDKDADGNAKGSGKSGKEG